MLNIIVPQFSDYQKVITLFTEIDGMYPVEIILPDPPNRSKVINAHRATSAQKWERIELPKSFNRYKGWNKESIYRSITKEEGDFIEDEYRKLDEGFWFMNNGKLTYISNHHYAFLNYWKIDVGYPFYKDVNRRFFLHWMKEENDKNSYGLCEMTRRREGKSYRAGCIAYFRTFSRADRYAGIQSKTNQDASQFLQKTIVSPWKKLPFFFIPNFDNTNNPREELRFYVPSTRGKASQQKLSTEEALESWIESRASVETAFDGTKLHTAIQDEAGKLIEADISARWGIVKICLEEDDKIIGKCLMTTTVEEMEKHGGKEFLKIWDSSDPNPERKNADGSSYLDGYGRTPSGLRQHFTPAYDGFKIDKYGNSLIEESITALQKERDGKKHNPSELSDLKRRKPFTIKECFRSAAGECYFNIEIIDARLEEFTFENKYVTHGDFVWKDNKPDTTVVWDPKPGKSHGKWVVSYLFPQEKDANKYFMSKGIKFPNNTTFGVAGADPFKFSFIKSFSGSLATGAVFMNHNLTLDPLTKDISKWESNRFIASYSYNKRNKSEYIDDLIKMCVYYGIKMYPEINVDMVWQGFEDRGYGGYLLYKKENGRISKQPGSSTSGEKFKEAMFLEWNEYINNHGFRCVHPELLEAAREADKEDLNPHDLFVAGGYALLGAKESFKMPTQKANASGPLFRIYEVK